MGFYLKKYITFFVEPYGLVFCFFIVGLILLFRDKKKLSKISLSTSLVFFFLFSYPPFSNYLVKNLEDTYIKYDYKNNIKYIHVLGGGHNDDESQPISSQISSTSLKRVLEGVFIHFKTKDSKLIFTGYEGSTKIANAKVNAEIAMAMGVKKENIIVNPKPKDTEEEANFARKLIKNEPFVLVTSATHMPRSMMLFKSVGLNPIPAPTNFYKSSIDSFFKLPNVYSFMKSQIAMHEYIGMLWSKIRSNFKK